MRRLVLQRGQWEEEGEEGVSRSGEGGGQQREEDSCQQKGGGANRVGRGRKGRGRGSAEGGEGSGGRLPGTLKKSGFPAESWTPQNDCAGPFSRVAVCNISVS